MTPEQATKKKIELEEKYEILVNDFIKTECRLADEKDMDIAKVLELELTTIEEEKDMVQKEIEFINDNFALIYEE